MSLVVMGQKTQQMINVFIKMCNDSKKCTLLSKLRIKYQPKHFHNDNFYFGIVSGYRLERVCQ